MKKLYHIIILLCCLGLQAQVINPLYRGFTGDNNYYYKDVDNDLNPYVGTWTYTNGTTLLTITLQKKIKQHIVDEHDDYYEDFLIGEYRYVENGVEKINTLNRLTQDLPPYDYNLVGNRLVTNLPGNRKVFLGFVDPDRDIVGMDSSMLLARADEGGVQKINLKFRATDGYLLINGQQPEFTSYTVPFGEYVLTKQP